MTKVTIVVPTYNVEQYIGKCLESLVNQTYQDYEIMVVNDGSPANEQVIIEEYAKKYSKIIPVVKENGGYGSVLQLAISKMTSDYFLICDPDDWLEATALEELVSTLENNNVDIVVGAKNLVFSDNDEVKYDKSYNGDYAKLEDNVIYENGTDAFNSLFFLEPSPHAKLYKRSLAEKIIFPTKVGYTDNLLYYISLLNAKKVMYVSKPLAYYLIDRAGNSRTDLRPAVIDALVTVFKTIVEQSKNIKDVPAFFYYRMFESFKFVFYKVDQVNSDIATYSEKLYKTKELLDLLVPYHKQVNAYYAQYATTQIVEKYKDKLLLNKSTSNMMFKQWVNKRIKERG